MYIGNYAADSYYGAKVYATAVVKPVDHGANARKNADICKSKCPWWNPLCPLDCEATHGLRLAGANIQQGGSNFIVDLVNQGTDQWNQNMVPALTMVGIAAVGLIAVVMMVH